MIPRNTRFLAAALAALALFASGWGAASLHARAQAHARLRSQVVAWDDAKPRTAAWGEMRTYFTGETYGTTNLLTAVAVVNPGQSVHPAHRHAEEEFLVVAEGSGTWHLDGKEFPAKKGDVLYVEPWVFHGLLNTGSEPLTFFVVRWNNQKVPPPPAPDGPHGR